MISGLTLEEIARSVADTFTATQLPTFFVDSGVPEELVPADVPGDRWEYVLSLLVSLHDGGSATRRTLRAFIGAWLSGRLHETPQTDYVGASPTTWADRDGTSRTRF